MRMSCHMRKENSRAIEALSVMRMEQDLNPNLWMPWILLTRTPKSCSWRPNLRITRRILRYWRCSSMNRGKIGSGYLISNSRRIRYPFQQQNHPWQWRRLLSKALKIPSYPRWASLTVNLRRPKICHHQRNLKFNLQMINMDSGIMVTKLTQVIWLILYKIEFQWSRSSRIKVLPLSFKWDSRPWFSSRTASGWSEWWYSCLKRSSPRMLFRGICSDC